MSVVDRRQDIASKLRELDDAGELTIVSIPGQDVDELADAFKQIEEAGLLFQIGLDPNALGGVLDALLQAGVPEDKMVSVNQGYRLAGSIKTTERKLAEYVLKHGGTALMKWSVANAKVKTVGNSIVITKQVSGSAKIDPLMALFNAVSLMALNPPSQCDSLDFKNIIIGG
jgi:phage terminase large subunit-like protein